LEAHVTYHQEVREGDPLRFTTQLLGHDGKRLHYIHQMYHAKDGYLAATNELVSLHVSQATRRSAPMAAGILDRLAGVPAAADARASDVILSVCPPHAAVDLAKEVAALRFAGAFVDGNAVSPATAREIGGIVEKAGATFVDGGIIGPPPVKPGSTRFYVSGSAAERIAALLTAGPLQAIVVPGGSGAASAVKMAYASWTKGSAALLLAVCALASAEGVEDSLVREWKISQPDLSPRAESAAKSNAKKAWRFIGEME